LKILFISLHNPNSIGVNKKVLQQISFFQDTGFDVKATLISPYHKETKKEGAIQFIKLEATPKIHPIFKRRYFREFQDYIFQNKYNKSLFNELDKYVKVESFDIIYFRNPLASFPLIKFAKRYKDKLVLEHNTKEIVEIELGIIKDSGLKYNFLVEKYFAKYLFRNCLCGVAVTNEIMEYENHRAGFDYCNFLYKNPIKTADFTPRDIPLNSKFTLSILIGSYEDWHGLDLLCNAIRESKKGNNFRLIYIGNMTEKVSEICKDIDVEFVGRQDQIGVRKYLSMSDITIGSLAPHRVKIKELSSLKSREYIAMGIPFIIGCPDTAFGESIAEINNYISIVDFEGNPNIINEIEYFINNIRKDKNHPQVMHDYAKNNLDYKPVFNKLKLYLKESLDAI
jgi:hypothetical protein